MSRSRKVSRFSKLQEAALSKAKRMLKKQPWFNGVCINVVPKDSEIKAKGTHWAAKQIWLETWYYDGQWWGG